MIELRHTCPQVLLAIGALYLLFIEHTRIVKLTQVAKNHFAFATALLWH
jgi:hypothetical protein